MKLSKKQIEVINLMKDTYIVWVSGLNPFCFLHKYVSYKLSIATFFKLKDSKLICSNGHLDNKGDEDQYILTDLAVELLDEFKQRS
jgi:hypothetical protein